MAASQSNLADLVAQLPDSDRDLAAAKKSEPAKRAGEWGKFTGPDPAKAEALFTEVLGGGAERVLELIRLIRPPGDPEFKSYKAEYLLHGLVVFVGRFGQEKSRAMLLKTLASQLDNAQLPKPVRALLARELQWIGDPSVAAALGRLLLDDELCDPAATTLVAIGDGADEPLRAALPKAKGRSRLVVVQSLGAIRDQSSLVALQHALADTQAEVRWTAAWALAQLGNPDAIPALLKASSVERSFERIQITQACLVLAEKLAGSGKKSEAARIYAQVLKTRTDPKEQYLRDAAKKGMDALWGGATS